jgi:Domain of unknown function (DUF5655)
MTWTCPLCQRQFGRNKQAHECAPAMTLEAYLETGPLFEAPIVRAVVEFLQSFEIFDDAIVEPVSVGVLMKRARTFAELRPMTKWEALWIYLPRSLDHPRISRRFPAGPGRTVNVLRLTNPDQFDEQARDWLTDAYEAG